MSVSPPRRYPIRIDSAQEYDRVIDLVDTYLAEPAFGLMARMKFLRKMCAKWVGEEQADALIADGAVGAAISRPISRTEIEDLLRVVRPELLA